VTAPHADFDMCAAELKFLPEHFLRTDDDDDAVFYRPERMVHHLDDTARATLSSFYGKTLPQNARVLDLMSSWVSHLPAAPYAAVTGLGMNRTELEANPQLSKRVVQNLNTDSNLPFNDDSFDACLIALSVQYLTQPLDVFAEIGRVLTVDGVCVVSFSNRCFPTKAVAIWKALDNSGHTGLVTTYIRQSGMFGEPSYVDLSPSPGQSDPLLVVHARAV
jgi:SAM-dependent methyltransferase